jgi:predicted O-linked N-acetylglucosamine transferase (SPINDLY family)
MRRRLVAAFDEFIDVRSRTDREVTALARERGIDIAIDLMGFTLDARPGIFALRAAPVQAGFLGYAGTLGAPYMDYFIGDAETLAPTALRDSFDERLVFLPGCYHPQDPRRERPGPAPSRESQGLPPAGFVFCCFNAPYKILPATFDRWMRILARVEGSVLWLRAPGEAVVANLRREASRRGIDPRRLVFAPRVPREEHLARHACAGLFLDTLPFNAHSTACDALWAELPVLTCAGDTFAGRVAASLLRAAGLPELVTASPEAYEEEAVRLATHNGVLSALAERLRCGTPLHDTDTWVRHFETALARMAARWHAGLPPETFEVKP